MDGSEEKPKNVRELLIETKEVCDLIIDLAYASVLYEDMEIAEQVRKLENRMDELMYQIRALVSISVRSHEDAESTTGILQIASAAESISNAAGDIANLVIRKKKIHPVVKNALIEADEKISKIQVGENPDLTGERVEELNFPSLLGIRILALKRDGSWGIPPEEDEIIHEGDILFVRGPRDGIDKFSYMADTEPKSWKTEKIHESLRKNLSEMKDNSSSLVDMAFSSVLFNSEEVAEEVRGLEEKFDELYYKGWRKALKAAKKEKEVTSLTSALQMVKSLETITDAADSIADVVLRGLEIHPVFAQALGETEEKIARLEISRNSSVVGQKLEDLELWRRMGIWVLAMKKGGHSFPYPRGSQRVGPNDKIIVQGPVEKINELSEVTRGKREWTHLK